MQLEQDKMIEVLQNKNSATRFQIMVELASSGPHIHQRNIASRLGITPQAVSEYIKQLSEENFITADDRYSYRVTIEGVNWMLKMLREMNEFLVKSTSAVKQITICAAIAEEDIRCGQVVGLKMKDGLLYATGKTGKGARGKSVDDASAGMDVGVTAIEGLVELARGRITILEVPTIQKGGSQHVDMRQLKKYLNNRQQAGVMGIEALAAARKAGAEPRYLFGVTSAAVEQARCGLSFTVLCTSDAIPELARTLKENNLEYDVISLSREDRRAIS